MTTKELFISEYIDLLSDTSFSPEPEALFLDPYTSLRRELFNYLSNYTVTGSELIELNGFSALGLEDEQLGNISLGLGSGVIRNYNSEFAGFIIYEKVERNKPLFFPCITLDILRTQKEQFFGNKYNEGPEFQIKLLFRKNDMKIIDGEKSGLSENDSLFGSIRLGEEVQDRLLEREELARYYNNMLRRIILNFKPESVDYTPIDINSVIIRPLKKNHTLFGVEMTVDMSFRGGKDWTAKSFKNLVEQNG